MLQVVQSWAHPTSLDYISRLIRSMNHHEHPLKYWKAHGYRQSVLCCRVIVTTSLKDQSFDYLQSAE